MAWELKFLTYKGKGALRYQEYVAVPSYPDFCTYQLTGKIAAKTNVTVKYERRTSPLSQFKLFYQQYSNFIKDISRNVDYTSQNVYITKI